MQRIYLRVKVAMLFLFVVCVTGKCLAEGNAAEQKKISPQQEERMALLMEAKEFEKKIGFKETDNFAYYSEETESYSLCYVSPNNNFPYSYLDLYYVEITEKWCSEFDPDYYDTFFYAAEVVAGRGTPVTRSMMNAPIARFLSAIFHEDCHEQMSLPAGLEEPACTLIGIEAAAEFSRKKFGDGSPEYASVKNYAAYISARAKLSNQYYKLLSHLYARHARKGNSEKSDLSEERDKLFMELENKVDKLKVEYSAPTGGYVFNNALLGFWATYDRHYPLIEEVFDIYQDTSKTFKFFMYVNWLRLSETEVMRKYYLNKNYDISFNRLYEMEAVEITKQVLAVTLNKRKE